MRILQFFFMAAGAVLLFGCTNKAQQEARKWRVTLDGNDKRPYGTWLAAKSLPYYFPHARVEALSPGFRYSSIDDSMKYHSDGRSLLVLQGLDFYISDREWESLKSFILAGNEVVIFCSHLDSKIEDELNCYKVHQNMEELPANIYKSMDAANDSLIIAGVPGKMFGYRGRSLKGNFSIKKEIFVDRVSDSASTDNYITGKRISKEIFGYVDRDGKEPDFVRFTYGKGHLTLHAAPLVLSNYFLLQPGNETYLAAIWKTFPDNITHVYQNDYYKRTTGQASIDALMRFPPARAGIYMALFILLIYLLFESKRKQRIIPIIPPVKNESVSFVETVGRLYYNKGDHTNLAEKMVQQFLDWVRMHYYLNTNLLNDQFIHQLTIRSGQPEPAVRGLMDMVHEIKTGYAKPDDAYLYQLYHTIQNFYKTNA